jgi:hemin uptake protein HemP
MIDEYSENYYRLGEMTPAKPRLATDSVPLAPAKVTSESLLGARKELVITHQGREYRLRVTQNGKLILTA